MSITSKRKVNLNDYELSTTLGTGKFFCQANLSKFFLLA